MNLVVLCFLFPTVSGYYWNKITELRDTQLETTLNTFRDSMESRGVSVVQSMSLSIHQAAAGFDFSFINTLLNQVVENDPDLNQCLVMDKNGVVVAHNDQSLIASTLTSALDKETQALFKTRFSLHFDPAVDAIEILNNQKNTLPVASAVYSGNTLWGILRCDYITDTLEDKIQSTKALWQIELGSMRNTFLTIAAVFFFLAVILALLFTGKLVKAMHRLIDGVTQVSNGDLLHKIDDKGLLVKELQSFATVFNEMSHNLHLSHKKLDEYNRSLEATVKLRTKELEESNRDLEAFSYSVSHDLRSPLRAINGFSDILFEDHSDELDEEGIQYLTRIQHLTKKTDDLIAGMLTVSRVGRSEIEPVTLNLNSMIEGIIEDIRFTNQDKECELLIQPNLTLFGDHNLVGIVFENLIANAWKYSSNNETIYIEIGTMRDNPEVFYIKDNGVGFEMDYVDKIFQPFQRLHKAEEFEGTGIGLATVARIIRRHSGKIWAESTINEGTTFFFSFTPLDDVAS